jgi:CheY-like chemotaxis protein
MDQKLFKIVLADDDDDDLFFFEQALRESGVQATLLTAINGVELMHTLQSMQHDLPDVVFLDLNMPRKTGLDCLTEIKAIEHLKELPVVIYSTSFDPAIVDLLFDKGARFYIRKPGDFSKLKQVIRGALTELITGNKQATTTEQFVLYPK